MKTKEISSSRRIYSVSEITRSIKHLLENEYPLIWISGEISNYRIPVSGHGYFTLKDDQAQIQCVIFRSQRGKLAFSLAEGMFVTGLGRISVYEPRGSYQIIFEHLDPGGIGAMQIAFEQLKSRLAKEGLFDEKHKRPLPYLPDVITVITSSTGAAIRDILNIIHRRFPNMPVEIVPVKVQGEGAVDDIVNAFDLVSRHENAEIVILARGGGSIEDLQPFNSERVARAIFNSSVPVVSAIGHETDFTIADFVSDLRAPTPSAAAELAVPLKSEFVKNINQNKRLLLKNVVSFLNDRRRRIEKLAGGVSDPRRRYQDLRLRLDDWSDRLTRAALFKLTHEKEKIGYLEKHLIVNNPSRRMDLFKQKLHEIQNNLLLFKDIHIDKKRKNLLIFETKLSALSPLNALARGYSITRSFPEGEVIRNASKVKPDQLLEIIVENGNILVKVKSG